MLKNKWAIAIVGTLTLGLAPFVPEPHFFGKVRWILGGGVGMQATDYFDLMFHGLPWIYLGYLIISTVIKNLKAGSFF
ncbi:hypothetical protein JKA74_17350 [Marivirga sp. S37H4]|uniref:RND transporter n=1 Tax=Marivirga aurantiaca TaxID=2802615 RepID=A0A934X0R2_9BACT|nr:hypothetical protein [Marivirga aurantiaca]MBK6266813.1 hypothetical protein [Marivirga aurantiaca]